MGILSPGHRGGTAEYSDGFHEEQLKNNPDGLWYPTGSTAEDIEEYLNTCRDMKGLPLNDGDILEVLDIDHWEERFQAALALVAQYDPVMREHLCDYVSFDEMREGLRLLALCRDIRNVLRLALNKGLMDQQERLHVESGLANDPDTDAYREARLRFMQLKLDLHRNGSL